MLSIAFAEENKDNFELPEAWDLRENPEDIQSALDGLTDKISSFQKLSVLVKALKEASQSDKAAEKLRERRRNFQDDLTIKEALQIMDLIKELNQSTSADQEWLVTKISEITVDSSSAETLVRFLLDQQAMFNKEDQKIRKTFLGALKRAIKAIPLSSPLAQQEKIKELIDASKLGEQEKAKIKVSSQ